MAVQSAGEAKKTHSGGYHVLISRLPLLPPLEYLSSVAGASLGGVSTQTTAVLSGKPDVISKGHTECPAHGNFKPQFLKLSLMS